ncbi:MAG: type IX secretion system sortase PorU [Candidatus Cloacimonadales bacterium]|jgi:hypothetical protein|nr:type IX secretion system sortase PorU [Candidatus Cloacimonadales bacterium]
MKFKLFLLLMIVPLSILFAYSTHIISETPHELQFIIKIDSLNIETNEQFSYIKDYRNMSFNLNEGEPELPFISYNIAVPENGSVSMSIKPINEYKKQLYKEWQPAPSFFYDRENNLQNEYKIDEKKYQNYRKSTFKIDQTIKFREYCLVPINIYPMLYDTKDKSMHIIDEMLVTVQISGNTREKKPMTDSWDDLYSTMILNWDTGKYYSRSKDELAINFAQFNKSNHWYSFEVNKDGIYRLNASQITDTPLSDIDPAKLRVFSTGGAAMSSYPNYLGHEFVEIPIYVSGAEDGNFDQNDYILLYARDRDGFGMNSEFSFESNMNGDFYYYNPFSGATKYWLTWGEFDGPAKRISIESSPNTWDEEKSSVHYLQHIETERARMNEKFELYYAWYTQKMEGRSNASFMFNFNIEDLDQSKEKYIRAFVKTEQAVSSSSERHHVRLSLNGTEFKSLQWTSASMQKLEGEVQNLTEGNNSMQLDVFRTVWSDMYFDFYDIIYYKKLIKRAQPYNFEIEKTSTPKRVKYQFANKPGNDLQVFKIKDFDQLSQITPNFQDNSFSFIAESSSGDEFWIVQNSDIININNLKREQVKDLSADHSQVDFVIITNKTLGTAADDLKQIYQEYYGVNARIAYQEDIINQFAGGNDDPIAIRNYLEYVYETCPAPKLKGVTLMGSGTIDWRNYSGMANQKNQVMTIFNKAQSATGGTFNSRSSSDQYYGYFNEINMPEIIIGRIPIMNLSDWEIYKNKLINYLNNKSGTWTNRVLMLADDFNYVSSITDTMHSMAIETIAAALHVSAFKEKIFAQDYPLNEFKKKPEVNDLFVSKINEGALLSIYMGHGDPVSVGDENYLRIEDMARLNNIDRLTAIFFGSCSVGRTDNPNIKSIAEYMIMNPGGGAIATIGALRDSYNNGNVTLMSELLTQSFNNRKSIGESFMLTCQKPVNQSFNTNVYQLLGDPLLPIYGPERLNNIILEHTNGEDTDNFQARETVAAQGSFAHGSQGETDIFVLDSQRSYNVVSELASVHVTVDGKNIFKGKSTLSTGDFSAQFIVPDDIIGGYTGKIVAYHYDEAADLDYINYLTNIEFAGHDYFVENNDAPQVDIYLESRKFRQGDRISQNPLLIVDMYDANGINILGSSGHEIVLLIDDSTEPIVITKGFIYDTDSHTKGTLYWQLNKLVEGEHTLKIIAFDNFNKPTVASMDFVVSKSSALELDQVLIYPNPVKKDAYFTFHNTEDAEIDIKIYTITGRKIKDIKAGLCTKGYNQIYWDGRDNDGDRIANNTYFYKITAKQINSGKKVEKIEKLIILK